MREVRLPVELAPTIMPDEIDHTLKGITCYWRGSSDTQLALRGRSGLAILTKFEPGVSRQLPVPVYYGFTAVEAGKLRPANAMFVGRSTGEAVVKALQAKRDVRYFESWIDLAKAITEGRF